MRKRLSILAVLLLAVAISAYSVGGTYAKYTSTFTGSSSTARVAKWAFTVGNETTALANDFAFDLFATINDSNGTSAETDVDVDGVDSDGDDIGDEKVIAPGTSGSFNLKLYNQSEVNATYAINYTVTPAGVPLEFSVNNGADWTSDLTDVTATAINMGANADITIMWRWAFTVDDDGTTDTVDEAAVRNAADTALGLVGTATPSVTAAITVTQVD